MYQYFQKCLAAKVSGQCLSLDLLGHLLEDAGPVAEGGLAEEAHGGIPGGAVAGERPAPVGDVGEGEPDGDAEGAGEVADAGVGADDEVEVLHHGGGVEESAAGSIEVVAERLDCEVGQGGELIVAVAFLEADERDAGRFGDGGEGGEREAAAAVALVELAALPGDADFEAGDV